MLVFDVDFFLASASSATFNAVTIATDNKEAAIIAISNDFLVS